VSRADLELVMQKLEDLSIGHRIAITVIIVLMILLAFALYGYLTDSWDVEAAQTQHTEPTWVPSKWDDHIDELERQALDEAFKKHIMQLFSVWVTDNYQPRIPPRALTGARNARDAYIRSMEAVEKRKELPQWKK
jgi:hypothetical protein